MRPFSDIADIGAGIALSEIEHVKTRRNVAPTAAPVQPVALGAPTVAQANMSYEWTIRLLNRYMRQSVLGYDGDSASFKWTTIQLNAFNAKAHVDVTNTPNMSSVVMAFGDFEGGEFLLVEQRPRAQSKAEIVPLGLGQAAIFPVHHRPARGTRGFYRLTVRHGVSRVRSGDRQTLGLIFHDAA